MLAVLATISLWKTESISFFRRFVLLHVTEPIR
jgi:hypothetical protein